MGRPLCTAIAATVRAQSTILDGEVVCLDLDGRPNFRALLFRRAEPVLYAFDVLMLDNEHLRGSLFWPGSGSCAGSCPGAAIGSCSSTM